MDKSKEIINGVFWGIVAAVVSLTLASSSNDPLGAVLIAVVILTGVVVTSTILLLRLNDK